MRTIDRGSRPRPAFGRGIARPITLAVLAGCAGGGVPGTTPQAPPRPPPSIATTPTDREIDALTAAPLAESEPALGRAIASHYERARSKRTYIQTDKPLYQPGETVWVRVDLRETGTLLGGGPLGLRLQLISPRGSIALAKRVLLQRGVARNDLALPAGLEGGEYTLAVIADDGTTDQRKLVISTYEAPRLQKSLEFLRKAYGEGDRVTAALELKLATGEPFGDRAATAVVTIDDVEAARLPVRTDRGGKATVAFALPATLARGDGLLTILAEDGGVTESIQRRIPIVMKTLQLGLFPEGGDLIDGVPGRVYFMAKTTLGKPADIEGVVRDDRGATVAQLASIHDGMGRFELVPATDRTYTVAITKPVGIAQTFTVPAAKPGGCVIRSVDQKREGVLRVAAICNTARELLVEATLRERRVGGGAFDVAAGTPTLIELPVARGIGQGVARVTLFSKRREPLAERLIYHAMDRDLRVAITADRGSYAPRDRVKLTVRTTDPSGAPVPANLALAVVDETVLSFADDKTARILARTYLEPELGATAADPIEEPNYYFSDRPDAAAALDALLATRGYRRFEWRPVLGEVIQ
jgi:alpha-2-macroglobulin-like protein